MLHARARWLQVSAGATATLVLLAALGTAGISYVAADRLIHPAREVSDATPTDLGIGYEDVRFASEDGVPLHGWWVPAQADLGTIVFLHGYGASLTQSLAVVPFLHAAGYNVLAFDFRAHGRSGGTHTSVGIEEAKDVRAAVAYVHANEGADEPVALFGWSMGAAAALNAMDSLPTVRAVVADSGFARLANVVSNSLSSFTGLPRYPFSPLVLGFASHMAGHDPDDNEPARHAASLRRPLLVIQGSEDSLARPDGDGATLAASAGTYAQYWLVPGTGHVDARTRHPSEYEWRVLSFLHEALRETP